MYSSTADFSFSLGSYQNSVLALGVSAYQVDKHLILSVILEPFHNIWECQRNVHVRIKIYQFQDHFNKSQNSLSLAPRIVSTGVAPSLLQCCNPSICLNFTPTRQFLPPLTRNSRATLSQWRHCWKQRVAPTASWCRWAALHVFCQWVAFNSQGHNSSSPLCCTLIQGFILQINSC